MTTITQRVVRRARNKYGLTVYHHDDWGSTQKDVYASRRRRKPVAVKKADTVVQHITVTRPSGDHKADMRVVERIGMDRFGSGVSYNFVVCMETGEIAVGQPLDARGTHTLNDKNIKGFRFNQNDAARAIAVLGMPGTPLSEKAERAISGLLAAMMDEGAITTTFDYVPHSLFAWKDCPCESTRGRMNAMRQAAVALREQEQTLAAAKSPVKGADKAARRRNRIRKARQLLKGALKWAEDHDQPVRAQKIRQALDNMPEA